MMFRVRPLLPLMILGFALTSACKVEPSGNDEAEGTGTDGIDSTTDGGTSTADTTADTVDTVDTVDTTADTTADSTTDTTTAGGECGNGNLEVGEECDDGNLMSGDGCSSTCTSEAGLVEIPCNGTVYQCGDMIDNDNDGLIDLDDKECISPCDDNESSFQTDLPGQNNDCKGDCYFDANSGGGDDQCEWNLMCDPANPGAQVGCEYDPNLPDGMCMIEMPPECLEFCIPLIPNGCDCFGCCLIDNQYVYLDSSEECTLDNLAGCESCTFNENCGNPCVPEECELCFGQDPEDLPDDCTMTSCPDNFPPCLDNADCVVEGTWCQTGCCVPVDIG